VIVRIKRSLRKALAYDRTAYRMFMDAGRPGYALAVLVGLWTLRFQPIYFLFLAWAFW